uniref:Carbamoyltransferase domain-containing protein n=1 Tax=Fibrocapsa japonica TaxID=94617 RepID=A0A7S2XZK2_9STRA
MGRLVTELKKAECMVMKAADHFGKSLVVGLNKYSHDASCCILSNSGEVLYIGSKERITRKKHDGGDTGELVEHALESIGAQKEDVGVVVCNNHHHPVLPLEKTGRLHWAIDLGHLPPSYASPHNLLAGGNNWSVVHHEISHHLAHAWSALTQVPFASGLVVVMDGMGESYQAMVEGQARGDYTSDLDLVSQLGPQDRERFLQALGMSVRSTSPSPGWTPRNLRCRMHRKTSSSTPPSGQDFQVCSATRRVTPWPTCAGCRRRGGSSTLWCWTPPSLPQTRKLWRMQLENTRSLT